MKRPLPTAETVRTAMDTVLAEATAHGRCPTISAVERHLGIAHATFYRHYQDLITDYFQPRARTASEHSSPATGAPENAEATVQRLRRENTDLRRTIDLYTDTIRQLALDNDALRRGGTVTPLPTHPRHRN